MCGIFGVLVNKNSDLTPILPKSIINNLFLLSESRGKEATGIAIYIDDKINIYKKPISAHHFIRTKKYKQILSNVITRKPISIIGHTRLATNGPQEDNDNNNPIILEDIVGVHNGIIVNDEDIWNKFSSMERRGLVDSEVIFSLLNFFNKKGLSLIDCIRLTFKNIEGSASIAAFLIRHNVMVLATNTGSLYSCRNLKGDIHIFASELPILQRIAKKLRLLRIIGQYNIIQLKSGYGCLVNLNDLTESNFSLNLTVSALNKNKIDTGQYYSQLLHNFNINEEKKGKEGSLRRCKKCILPETMPFIKFNEEGICNYCLNYKKIEIKGEEVLKELIAKYRSRSGKPDCVVAFSGGRDSSYGLHYVKRVLNMNPIAFTYDWAMVADIARRNQSRLVSKLGVEHIIISGDIKKKRRYIKQYIEAWLKRPHLGMIPLFMAGDKPVEYYVTRVAKNYGIKLIFLCRGNELETSEYKFGFLGVKNSEPGGVMHDLSIPGRLRLALAAAWQYILNPAYFNSSLFETLFAYWTTYMMRFNFIYLWHYVKWEEDKIISTLKEDYNWETEKGTILTWRIDDGTSPFYNYIYCSIAGFTENDAFRSNQIREGILTREDALKIVKEENRPRYEAIRDYFEKIGLNYDAVTKKIDTIPKLTEV